jgi:hypothetical protein
MLDLIGCRLNWGLLLSFVFLLSLSLSFQFFFIITSYNSITTLCGEINRGIGLPLQEAERFFLDNI